MKPLPPLKRKIKIFAYGDSPVVPSGFGTVMRNLFYYLAKTGRYDITIFGINDRGSWKDPLEHPYKVYQALPPGEQDVYGRSRFVDIMRGGGIDLTPDWDIVFFLNDPFVLENPIPFFNIGTLPAVRDIQKTHYTQLPPDSWFKTVAYWPVDSYIKPHWVHSAIGLVDRSVCYTHYGVTEIEKTNQRADQPLKLNLQVIPHGNNPDHFFPLDKEVVAKFRADYFKGMVRPETFLVIVVGRNQSRKDIPRAMKVFKEFQKRRPDSFLYIHAEENEVWGSIREAAHAFDLIQNTDWAYPQDFIAIKGFPTTVLNAIYNAADVHLSTTQGEGWGLPITETMATKTINLAPNITSVPEIFNTEFLNKEDVPLRSEGASSLGIDKEMDRLISRPIRGIPIKAGTTSSEWIMHGKGDLERTRPLTNVDDAVAKLLWIYDHPQEVKKITQRSYQWISRLTWQNLALKWDRVFTQVYLELQRERQHPEPIVQKWLRMPPPPSRPHPHTAHLSDQSR